MTWQKTPQRSLCFFLWGRGLCQPQTRLWCGVGVSLEPLIPLAKTLGQARHGKREACWDQAGTGLGPDRPGQALRKLDTACLFMQRGGTNPLSLQTWATPVAEPPCPGGR